MKINRQQCYLQLQLRDPCQKLGLQQAAHLVPAERWTPRLISCELHKRISQSVTVASLCNICFCDQENCPYIELSLLRDTSAVKAVLAFQLPCPYSKMVLILSDFSL